MTLLVHNIKPARGSKHSKKRVGRGNASGSGNYSGRGMKGQSSRSGSSGLRLRAFKNLMQATPKLRGFKSLNTKPETIRLSDLEKFFNAGDSVTLATLKEKKIIGINKKSAKIVLKGELTKKLIIDGIAISNGAKEIVEKNGGSIQGLEKKKVETSKKDIVTK